MDQNVTKKIILFALLLMIVSSAIAVVAILKPSALTDVLDRIQEIGQPSTEKVYEKCVSDVKKTSAPDLVANLYDHVDDQINAIDDYLTCTVINKVANLAPDEENYYEETKNAVQNLEDVSGNGKKQDLLSHIYIAHIDYSTQVALGDLTKLCPDKLRDLCVKDHDNLGISDKDDCDVICEQMDRYFRNGDELRREILSGVNWATLEDSPNREGEKKLRAAMAYRFGGVESAVMVCESSRDCKDFVAYMARFATAVQGCDIFQNDLVGTICGAGP